MCLLCIMVFQRRQESFSTFHFSLYLLFIVDPAAVCPGWSDNNLVCLSVFLCMLPCEAVNVLIAVRTAVNTQLPCQGCQLLTVHAHCKHRHTQNVILWAIVVNSGIRELNPQSLTCFKQAFHSLLECCGLFVRFWGSTFVEAHSVSIQLCQWRPRPFKPRVWLPHASC